MPYQKREIFGKWKPQNNNKYCASSFCLHIYLFNYNFEDLFTEAEVPNPVGRVCSAGAYLLICSSVC